MGFFALGGVIIVPNTLNGNARVCGASLVCGLGPLHITSVLVCCIKVYAFCYTDTHQSGQLYPFFLIQCTTMKDCTVPCIVVCCNADAL